MKIIIAILLILANTSIFADGYDFKRDFELQQYQQQLRIEQQLLNEQRLHNRLQELEMYNQKTHDIMNQTNYRPAKIYNPTQFLGE